MTGENDEEEILLAQCPLKLSLDFANDLAIIL